MLKALTRWAAAEEVQLIARRSFGLVRPLEALTVGDTTDAASPGRQQWFASIVASR